MLSLNAHAGLCTGPGKSEGSRGNPKVLFVGGQKTHWRASIINPTPSLRSALAIRGKSRLNVFIAARDMRSRERNEHSGYASRGRQS